MATAYSGNGQGSWRFKIEYSYSVSGLTGTITYSVKAEKNGGADYSGRTNTWCKIYHNWVEPAGVDTIQHNLNNTPPLQTYSQATNGKNPYNETVPNNTDKYLYSGTTILKNSFNVNLSSSTGKASQRIVLVGGFGSSSAQCTADFTIELTGGWTNHTKIATLSIHDNGNNTCTISGNHGIAGINNPIIASALYWTTNGVGPSGGSDYTSEASMGTTSGGRYTKTIDIPSKCKTVIAVIYDYFEHEGNYCNTGGHVSGEVHYYSTPGAPGTPMLNTTLTLNENGKKPARRNWHFYWSPAGPGNCSSNVPIGGYRIRVFRKAAGETTWNTVEIKGSSGKSYGTWNDTDDWVYDKTSTDFDDASRPTFSFNPEQSGFQTGDSLKIGLYSWVKVSTSLDAYGRLWNGGGWATAQVYSSEYIVDPAGVMRIKTDEKADGTPIFSEGRVFVKTGDGNTAADWTEAKTVKVKTSTNGNGDIWSDAK